VVTVALDTGGAEAAGPWIDRAKPTHPSLIDQGHLLDELLGVVNVPMGVWVDEEGMLVRPPEPAFPWRPRPLSDELMAQLPEVAVEQLREAQKMQIEPEAYVAALRDWVEKGPASQYGLSPEEVIERSRPRDSSESEAAAAFELGQHLHRTGKPDAAVRWFREAHRLAPDNWTYKRQAWSLADPLQDRTELYDSDWLTDVRKIGAENYYPPVKL
jgi:tetratricopeptide (TPR) repeat protein